MIKDSSLDSLVFTETLLRDQLRIAQPSQLVQLAIVNTTISRLQLCQTDNYTGVEGDIAGAEVEAIGGVIKEKSILEDDGVEAISCDEAFSSLEILDLRDNRLTYMTEFQLPSLRELYLSGIQLPTKHF